MFGQLHYEFELVPVNYTVARVNGLEVLAKREADVVLTNPSSSVAVDVYDVSTNDVRW